MLPRNFDEFSTHIINQIKSDNTIHSLNVNLETQIIKISITTLNKFSIFAMLDSYLKKQHFEYTTHKIGLEIDKESFLLTIRPHIQFSLIGEKPIQ